MLPEHERVQDFLKGEGGGLPVKREIRTFEIVIVKLQSNPAISNSVNSRSPLFRGDPCFPRSKINPVISNLSALMWKNRIRLSTDRKKHTVFYMNSY